LVLRDLTTAIVVMLLVRFYSRVIPMSFYRSHDPSAFAMLRIGMTMQEKFKMHGRDARAYIES
jgi:hypothetical protein